MAWRDKAACRGMSADLFHEEKPYNWPKKQLERAKAICATCPVTQECLQFAIDNRQSLGIWGGLTYKERLAFRKGTGVSIQKRTKSAEMPHGTDSRYQREIREARNGIGTGPCELCRQAHRVANAEGRARANA